VTALLSVNDLHVWLDTARGPLTIVDGVSFDVAGGQVFGLAGESGSGKTITALALLGLLPPGARTGGSAIMGGRDILAMRPSVRRRTRGREIAMVFQDPTSSLHPMLTIEHQLTEHLRYQLGLSGKDAHRRAVALLTDVRIPDPEAAMRGYPHQFSGGMRQRIQIAIGLACERCRQNRVAFGIAGQLLREGNQFLAPTGDTTSDLFGHRHDNGAIAGALAT